MRAFPFALLLAAAAVIAILPAPRNYVRFVPVALDRDHPAHRDFGALELQGVWTLTSSARGFGGISALHVEKGEAMALSDAGNLLRFRVNQPSGEVPLRIQPLPGSASPDHDTESLVVDPSSGAVWAGYETSNAIRRFSSALDDKKGWAVLPEMANWPENLGPEAMVRLADGRFVIFSEATPAQQGGFEALLVRRDPTRAPGPAIRFVYRPPEGFHPTDAAVLPDGRLLVLNRHFSMLDGVAAALVILDPARIAPGVVLSGHEIARLAPPLTIDNMEGLSIERTAKRGRVIVWLASDDNFNPLQQSLLMRFALDLEHVR